MQMNLQISPYEGVGPIKLGMTQDEVRKAVGTDFKLFMKGSTSAMPTDDFIGTGIHVFYRKPGLCEAVEMFSPASPTFRGYRLIGIPFSQLATYFRQEDQSTEIDAGGLTSQLLGVGLYVPFLKESQDSSVESVIVFEKGYYNS